MQGALALHKEQLASSLEVHAFNRDVDNVDERISEKVSGFGGFWGFWMFWRFFG